MPSDVASENFWTFIKTATATVSLDESVFLSQSVRVAPTFLSGDSGVDARSDFSEGEEPS